MTKGCEKNLEMHLSGLQWHYLYVIDQHKKNDVASKLADLGGEPQGSYEGQMASDQRPAKKTRKFVRRGIRKRKKSWKVRANEGI